jgi:hypothetical protein
MSVAVERLCVHVDEERDVGLLLVRADVLEREDFLPFHTACRRLLESDRRCLVFELRRLRIITSQFVSAVLEAIETAQESGRRAVVSCSPTVGVIFRALLADNVELHVAGRFDTARSSARSGRWDNVTS